MEMQTVKGIGQAHQKKIAKTNAADECKKAILAYGTDVVLAKLDQMAGKNSVSALNELTQKLVLKPPAYQELDNAPATDPQGIFRCECSVELKASHLVNYPGPPDSSLPSRPTPSTETGTVTPQIPRSPLGQLGAPSSPSPRSPLFTDARSPPPSDPGSPVDPAIISQPSSPLAQANGPSLVVRPPRRYAHVTGILADEPIDSKLKIDRPYDVFSIFSQVPMQN